MNWKGLFLGIALIVLIGVGGLVYRNALEQSKKPIACPMDARVCPDGTSVARTGLSCTFPECPPPNVSLPEIGISFAVPPEAVSAPLPDEASVAAYAFFETATSTEADMIIVRRYALATSTTALATIQQTAISGASGQPISAAAFSSKTFGARRFTVAAIGRFEGVVNTAYYLVRGSDLLRFDAIDREVANWTDPSLNISMLPAHAALIKLLTNLQGE